MDLVEKELIAIGAAGNKKAFYDAGPDEFLKELAAVGRIAVNYPTGQGRYIPYSSLLAVMASNITKADLEIVDGTSTTAAPQIRLDARNRIQQMLNQGINAFGISNSWWWQNGLHAAAFISTTILAYVAVKTAIGNVRSSVALLGTAVLAGFLAPVARDLVAAIQKLRG